jgi:magnesium transporter
VERVLGKLLLPTIQEAIEKKEYRTLKEALSEIPSIDLADLVQDLEETERTLIFRLLPTERATEVFEFLSVTDQEDLLSSLSTDTCRQLLEQMSPDDRTQLLEELPAEVTRQLLALLSSEERRLATTMLGYPEESVGRLMTTDFIDLRVTMTAGEALQRIREVGLKKETVYYTYVIDKNRKLLGIISLKDLVLSDPETRIEELMFKNVISCRTIMDQEEAANLLKKYDLLALPVVDRDDKLVGIITVDDLMDVLDVEATEDIQMMAAVVPTERAYLEVNWRSMLQRRLPWLMTLLFIELLAALVLKHYSPEVQTVVPLLFFLPALIATGGNTGTQSSTMVIRALATGDIRLGDILRVVRREIFVGLSLSLILGIVIFMVARVLVPGSGGVPAIFIALTVGMGLGVVVTVANLAGTTLPFLLKTMRLDPALMSGPFISTTVDVAGLIIYLEIARHVLSRFLA